MNVKMLKLLSEMAGGAEADCVDVDEFFERFPKNPATLKELRILSQSGYISLLDADDDISTIGVNKKAHDFFKR